MSRYQVSWTVQATRDLEEIFDYTENDSPKAALSLFKKIKSSCSKLNTYPERNRIIPELADFGISNYREIVLGHYRIICTISKNSVYIFAVFDGRRDIDSFLFKRLVRI